MAGADGAWDETAGRGPLEAARASGTPAVEGREAPPRRATAGRGRASARVAAAKEAVSDEGNDNAHAAGEGGPVPERLQGLLGAGLQSAPLDPARPAAGARQPGGGGGDDDVGIAGGGGDVKDEDGAGAVGRRLAAVDLKLLVLERVLDRAERCLRRLVRAPQHDERARGAAELCVHRGPHGVPLDRGTAAEAQLVRGALLGAVRRRFFGGKEVGNDACHVIQRDLIFPGEDQSESSIRGPSGYLVPV